MKRSRLEATRHNGERVTGAALGLRRTPVSLLPSGTMENTPKWSGGIHALRDWWTCRGLSVGKAGSTAKTSVRGRVVYQSAGYMLCLAGHWDVQEPLHFLCLCP